MSDKYGTYAKGYVESIVSGATANATLVAAVAGSRVVVDQVFIATNGANNVNLESDATDLAPFWYLAANDHVELHDCHIKTAVGEALKWTTSAATNASIRVVYHFE